MSDSTVEMAKMSDSTVEVAKMSDNTAEVTKMITNERTQAISNVIYYTQQTTEEEFKMGTVGRGWSLVGDDEHRWAPMGAHGRLTM